MYHKSQEPPLRQQERSTRPLRTAEIGRLNRNISGDATAFQPKILYHLRNSHASRNTRSMLAVIFIPKKERKMILWQQQKNYHQGHGDA